MLNTAENDAPYVIGEISSPATAAYAANNQTGAFTGNFPPPTIALDDGSYLVAYRVSAPTFNRNFNFAASPSGTVNIGSAGGVPSEIQIFNAHAASPGSIHYFVAGRNAANLPVTIEVFPVGGRVVITAALLANFAENTGVLVTVTGLASGSGFNGLIMIDQTRFYDPAGPTETVAPVVFGFNGNVAPNGVVSLASAFGQVASFELLNISAWTTATTGYRLVISTQQPLDVTGVTGVLGNANLFTGIAFQTVLTVTPAAGGLITVPETLYEQIQSNPASVVLTLVGAIPGAAPAALVHVELPTTVITEGLYLQHFDANGTVIGEAVLIDNAGNALVEQNFGDEAIHFTLQRAPDGTAIVSWLSDANSDGQTDTIFVQQLDVAGTPTGNAVALSGVDTDALASLADDGAMPAIAQLADGSFAIGFAVVAQELSTFVSGTAGPGSLGFAPVTGQLASFQLTQFTAASTVTAVLTGDNPAGATITISVAITGGGFILTDAILSQFAPDSHFQIRISGLTSGTPFAAVLETRDIFEFDASSDLTNVNRSGLAANNPGSVPDVFANSFAGQAVSFSINGPLAAEAGKTLGYFLLLSSPIPLDLTGVNVYAGPSIGGLLVNIPNTFSNGLFISTIVVTPVNGIIDVPAAILAQVHGDGLRALLEINNVAAGSPYSIDITVRHPSNIVEPGIYTQLFDADGNATGAGQRIDDPDGSLASAVPPASDPGIAIESLNGGGYRVSWISDTNGDGEGDTLVSRGFDAGGLPSGPQLAINAEGVPAIADFLAAGANLLVPEQFNLVPLGNGGYATIVQVDAPLQTSFISEQTGGQPVFLVVPSGQLESVNINQAVAAGPGSIQYVLIGVDPSGNFIARSVLPVDGRITISEAMRASFAFDSEIGVQVNGLAAGSTFSAAYNWEDVWNFNPDGATFVRPLSLVVAANGIGTLSLLRGEATAFHITGIVPGAGTPSYTLIVDSAQPLDLASAGITAFTVGNTAGFYRYAIPTDAINGTVTVPAALLGLAQVLDANIRLFVSNLQPGSILAAEVTVLEPVSTITEGLYVQLFDSNGAPDGAPIRVDSSASVLDGQDIAQGAIRPDGQGGFIVIWKGDADNDGDADSFNIQHFDASGNALGTATSITDIPDRVYDEDALVTIYTAGIFADPDPGDTLTFSASGLPIGLTINPNSGVIGGAAAQSGLFTIVVTATDQAGLQASSSFTMLVFNTDSNPDNNAPTTAVAAESFAGAEDTAIAGTLLTGFDLDGDTLTFAAGAATYGSVVIDPVTGAFTFTPDADFYGEASFQYSVSDGTLSSAPKTVAIQVAAVNDAPTAITLSNVQASVAEGGLIKVADITVSDDNLGTNLLSLAGADAARFSISNGALWFNGADYEALPTRHSFDVTVLATDASVSGSAPASTSLSISLIDVAEAKSFGGNSHADNLVIDSQSIDNWSITGAAGNDKLWAGAGNDSIDGGAGNDDIRGGGGTDVLNGGAGSDTINGGTGNDTIRGGTSGDTLTGGLGEDIFVYGLIGESAVGRPADHITDFALGDLIDLSLIDANTRSKGDQAFTFTGLAAFSGAAGELRYDVIGGDVHLFGDINGDRKADFEIVFDGVNSLPLNPAEFLIA